MQKTIELAKKLHPDFVQYAITVFYPATKIYQEAVEQGRVEDLWKRFAQNPDYKAPVPIASDLYSREEMVTLLTRAYNSFYLRPQYVWQRLKKVKSWSEFKRQARAGLQMLWYKLKGYFRKNLILT